MTLAPSTPEELDQLAIVITSWIAEQRAENPAVASVEGHHTPPEYRWFMRLHGEEKDVFSVWFHLRQRNLHVETYMMPAPEENQAELYEHLLRRNAKLEPFSFCIGEEDGVFLTAAIPNAHITRDALDHLLGSAYQFTEQCFRPAMRIGYASKFRG